MRMFCIIGCVYRFSLLTVSTRSVAGYLIFKEFSTNNGIYIKACFEKRGEVSIQKSTEDTISFSSFDFWCKEFAAMYSSNIAIIFFGITFLFPISYQYTPEYLPTPPPRDPPDQSQYYRDIQAQNYTVFYSQTKWWACARRAVLYMRWPDSFTRKNQSDLWFDRLVYIHHEGNYDFVIREYTDYGRTYNIPIDRDLIELSITVNGVIFDDDRILTSYNPFRQIIKYAFKRHFTHVCALNQRRANDTKKDILAFRTTYHSIACARQVVPLEETMEMPINLWHGKAHNKDYMRQHSPLHDLMVIRIEGFIRNMTKHNYDFDFLAKQTHDFFFNGPQKSILAKKDDVMGSEFKFGMMGHIFRDPKFPLKKLTIPYTQSDECKNEGKRMRNTYVGFYTQADNVLVDCDEWIPREWGWFICVLNKQGLKRLASGAALYSRGLLFGIGSFTLFKGNDSIIVFTDVRPYESLITDNKTGPCTTTDQYGKKKPPKKASRSHREAPSTQEKNPYKN